MSASQSRCWAVLPAAGTGSRMGREVPKQYLQVAGATLLEHSLVALLACPEIELIAVPLHVLDHQAAELSVLRDPRIRRLTGGAQRSDSVLAGLACLAEHAAPDDWVLVHDAARPCVSPLLIQELIARVCASGVGGILAQPVVDTVKQAGDDGRVVATLDRSMLWRAQTPQMFRLSQLREALQDASHRGLPVTDEASAMELAGHPVQLVPGSARNLKVTVPEDLSLAQWYLQQNSGAGVE